MSRHMYLPRGKRIVLYRSGDKFYSGAPFTLNPRYIKNLDDLLSEATTKVDAVWGAARTIHTPNTGTVIHNIDSITPQGTYVVAGPKGFIHIPGGYDNIGRPVLVRKRRTGHSRNPSRRSLYDRDKIKVTVYRNGDASVTYPFSFTAQDYDHWDKALDRLSEDVPNGPIRRIFFLSGNRVQSPQDLINHGTYVVGKEWELFQPAQYGDVTLGVEDGATTFRSEVDRRWSLSSQSTQDSRGRLSKIPGASRPHSRKVSRKENEWETERWSEGGEEQERDWRSGDEYGDEAENSYYANYNEIEEEEVREEDRREQESEWIGVKELEEEGEGAYATGQGESEEREEREEEEEEEEGGEESSNVIVFGGSMDELDYRFYGESAFSLHTPIAEESEGDLQEEEDEEEEDEVDIWRDDDDDDDEGVRSRSRLSIFDSGHASLLSDEDRPDSVFRAKTRLSRPATQAREVDYDTDDGGVYKAKHRSNYAAQEVLESSATNIELPVDLVDAAEVQEEIAV